MTAVAGKSFWTTEEKGDVRKKKGIFILSMDVPFVCRGGWI